MSFKALFLFPLFFLALVANCRELTDISLEIATQKQGNEAKQEAFDRATEEATHRLTEELLGPERTAKVWASVRSKLLKSSTRYVQFIKGSVPVDGKVQVQMRISADNLETLLREAGALGNQSVRLLPLVAVSEPQGTRYVWWADASESKKTTLAQDIFKKFFQQVNARFKSKNVYVLDPTNASFRMGVPSSYRSEGLSREDVILLAQYLKADVVLSGRVDVVRAEGSGPRLNYDLQLWQAKVGRGLTETQRSEPAPSEVPKVLLSALDQNNERILTEFAQKLQEAIMAGSLNLNTVRIAVEGPLAYKQQADFKRQLSSVREIKLLRERLFEVSRVTFEAETAVKAAELAQSLKRAQFPQFKMDVESVRDDSLVLSVTPLSPPNAQ